MPFKKENREWDVELPLIPAPAATGAAP